MIDRRALMAGLAVAPALAAMPAAARQPEQLTAAEIVGRAHAAAGGADWMRPRSLTLAGRGMFWPQGTQAGVIEVPDYRMWRVYPTESTDAHTANGWVRIDARLADGSLWFQAAYDGETSYNQQGPVPGAQASRQPLPRSLDDLRAALAAGQRDFSGLSLADLDGVDLDLAGCNLREGCFLEARFGHARFTGSDLVGCGFQRALLWGADLSMVRAQGSLWQEADLSGPRLQEPTSARRCCTAPVCAGWWPPPASGSGPGWWKPIFAPASTNSPTLAAPTSAAPTSASPSSMARTSARPACRRPASMAPISAAPICGRPTCAAVICAMPGSLPPGSRRPAWRAHACRRSERRGRPPRADALHDQLSVFTAREITITSSTNIKVEWSNWISFTLVPTGE